MDVTTEDKKLRLVLKDSSKALKTFGPCRGSILLKRVRNLLDAETLEDVRMEIMGVELTEITNYHGK